MIDPLKNTDLVKEIRDLKRRILDLETKTLTTLNFGTSGVLSIPQLTADPSSPSEGQMWVNTTSHVFKIRINGVTKTVTLT